MTFEATLISIWRQSLIENAKVVTLGNESFPVLKPSSTRIKIDDPKDVADVRVLNELVTSLSRKVTACVDAGRELATCRCSYPDDVGGLRTGYDTFMKRHPRWKDQMLSYEYAVKGRTITGVLSLQTLRQQLESLKCE
jgi:hypothetical protein